MEVAVPTKASSSGLIKVRSAVIRSARVCGRTTEAMQEVPARPLELRYTGLLFRRHQPYDRRITSNFTCHHEAQRNSGHVQRLVSHLVSSLGRNGGAHRRHMTNPLGTRPWMCHKSVHNEFGPCQYYLTPSTHQRDGRCMDRVVKISTRDGRADHPPVGPGHEESEPRGAFEAMARPTRTSTCGPQFPQQATCGQSQKTQRAGLRHHEQTDGHGIRV